MSEPRCVVVGYGNAGRAFHAYLVGLTPGLALHGVCARNPERRALAESHGHRTYATYEDVLSDRDVDLVVLATPNDTHAELAIRALDAGKHVVTDKVMCLTLADCDRMIAAARRNDRLLSVFQNRRWDGDFLTLEHLVSKGKLGRLRYVEMAWQGFGAWGGWRGSKASGGGKLYDLGAHLVDQLCLLFPAPVSGVYCRMHHDIATSEVESHALVVIEFADGATGVSDTSSLAAIAKPRIRALGTAGTFVKYGLDPQEAAMKGGDIDAAVEPPEAYGRLHDGKSETVVMTLAGRWRTYYENVRDCIADGAEPLVKLEQMRRAIGVIDAAFRSAATGRVVTPDA